MTLAGLYSRAIQLHLRITTLWYQSQRRAPDLHGQIAVLERRAYAVREALRRRLVDAQQ